MDATATLNHRTPLAQLARGALLTAIAGYLALSISLFARRIVGDLQPLAAPALLALVVGVPAAMLLVPLLWTAVRPRRAVDWFVRLAPTASAMLLALAVSLRGSSPALAALWLAIVAVEATMISRALRFRPRRAPSTSPFAPRPSPSGPQTTQSIVRQRDAAGMETISGELRGSFRAGERTIFLHVAFCPPLASAPAIEWKQIAGPSAEIKVAQAQAFGARFDVRLKRESADPVDATLRFTATSLLANSRADSGS